MFGPIIELYHDASPDGLSQTQREALIDLLVLAARVDRHTAAAELDAIDDQLEDLTWNSVTPVNIYLGSAISRARDASASDETRARFLNDIARRLDDPPARHKALDAAVKLIEADERIDEAEHDFLIQIRKALRDE